MKVRELIELLSKFDPEMTVVKAGHSDSDWYSNIHSVDEVAATPTSSYNWKGSWDPYGENGEDLLLID